MTAPIEGLAVRLRDFSREALEDQCLILETELADVNFRLRMVRSELHARDTLAQERYHREDRDD